MPEAGGKALIGVAKGSRIEWRPVGPLVENWDGDTPSAADLRRWYRPMLFGPPAVVDAVAAGIRPRGGLSRRLRRLLR